MIDARVIAEELGLDNIAGHLDFINQAPEYDREFYVREIKYEIDSYHAQKLVWKQAQERGVPKKTQDFKRTAKAEHKKRIKYAEDFLKDINVPLLLTNEPRETISLNAKFEILNYIRLLQEETKDNQIGDIINQIALSQPNDKKIEKIIKEIYERINISGVSDTLKAILPLIK